MTYAMGEALQTAVYQRLVSDPEVTDLTKGAVFDSVPDPAPDLFVALGPEKVRNRSDNTGPGASHEFRVSVVTRRQGYLAAKSVAACISDAMIKTTLTLSRGSVVFLRFVRAEARRDEGEGTRRIDLWFQARLADHTTEQRIRNFE
ncbi:DUF3168 domain-containing protein [uncultured Jannaschia sp.]|uniref:DUF3168 domain-containing protein n=1 Tax=uncultured Jannaschia sp. TaxID=293347 RepID=UPI002619332C|nr:DUF3168 domain-containing protein [uncultured Jannaschia sp.]